MPGLNPVRPHADGAFSHALPGPGFLEAGASFVFGASMPTALPLPHDLSSLTTLPWILGLSMLITALAGVAAHTFIARKALDKAESGDIPEVVAALSGRLVYVSVQPREAAETPIRERGEAEQTTSVTTESDGGGQ